MLDADADAAKLLGVTIERIRAAARLYRKDFPAGSVFQLTVDEDDTVRREAADIRPGVSSPDFLRLSVVCPGELLPSAFTAVGLAAQVE